MNEAYRDPSQLDGIPLDAADPIKTAVDYIVVGSGTGGAPLAVRLARAGMRVLVLEAGLDSGAPAVPHHASSDDVRNQQNEHLFYYCPGLHAASTEPDLHEAPDQQRTNWNFWVRHYRNQAIQRQDSKARDDCHNPDERAVLYPRSSALGGCTAHNAMISVCGTDYDWQQIADLTGDNSWAPPKMHSLFKRIARVRSDSRLGWLHLGLDWLSRKVGLVSDTLDQPDSSRWMDVRLSDPKLAMGDTALFKVIAKTIFEVDGRDGVQVLMRAAKRFIGGRLFQDLDLNDVDKMRTHPEGVALVPLAVSPSGVRRGPRDWLLETRRALRQKQENMRSDDGFVGELWIATGIFVRRVVFRQADGSQPPRAIGVEFSIGQRLYDPGKPINELSDPPKNYCYARREIILCGGAFNTPQLLMVSGVGDQETLQAAGVQGIPGIAGETQAGVYINLPGVGKNLRDRYEISVISEMAANFSTLNGVKFDPNATDDPALNEWKAKRAPNPRPGLYATNGAALAILKRSKPASSGPKDSPPDLLFLGFPIAFQGYYPGWSMDLLKKPCAPSTERSRNLWSWTILKAYSKNRGVIRLRTSNPFDSPDVDFCYFGQCDRENTDADPHWRDDPDFAALEFGVQYVRRLNHAAAKLMKGSDPAAAELCPGAGRPSGSPGLEAWIAQEAWGHHASGTCRIGSDPWRANGADLKDKEAVLDSHFRVHGASGLRIVDASVFPTIPGYFITVPTCLISEKAADTIIDELSF
ncbi:MAG: GMC family oxidoreductase [Verrucomicrobia bacterium]|nr:GMC family oxidoreductase [Verrucomicrobiota bacterium]